MDNIKQEVELSTKHGSLSLNVNGVGGSFAGGVIIFVGIIMAGVSIGNSLMKSAAINQNMTPQEYVEWVSEVASLKAN